MKTDLLIDGQWRSGAEHERIDVFDPATGEVVDSVAAGTPADATAAVDAAAAAQPGWRQLHLG